jgi:hypothetical protein
VVNKIVEESRREANKQRYIEKNRILEIKESDEKYRMCACCGIKDDKDKKSEISIGHHNQSITFCLCKECLSKLGDIIWEVS